MSRALAKIDDFTWQGVDFDAWLTGICRNVCHEHWRAVGRDHPVADPAAGLATDEQSQEDRVVDLDRADALRLAFATLSDADREVLELRVVSELDAAATGQVLGKQAGAVRMAQSRALDRLREAMRGLGHDG